MSTIIQQPDSLSFSGNLKKFEITSLTEVIFELKQVMLVDGHVVEKMILSEKYNPDADGLLTIDIKAVIERLLEIIIPSNQGILTEQPAAVGNFFARIDNIAIPLTVIKGGVAELQETAESFLSSHFLTWQPQDKEIIQTAPEWIGLYPIAAGDVKVKAYYADNTSVTAIYTTLEAGNLYSVNTAWSAVSAWLTTAAHSSQVVAWDVWFEVGGVQKTPVQRYRLRNDGFEEHVFIWVNTVGGIDSISFTGTSEEAQNLEHQNAIFDDETIEEYNVEQNREIRQSTGYMDASESRWVEDFFFSRNKYIIRPDGSIKQIVVVSSKIVRVSSVDEFEFEFNYKFGADTQLLNLDRTMEPLPAPEGLDVFFLTKLLSGLTAALYQDNLLMAVQSPFAEGWQKLSMSQLWGGALPTLVDGTTITVIDGKLKVLTGGVAGESGASVTWEELKIYIDSLTNANVIKDTRTELVGGAILWREGLTYDSLNISYKILGVTYHAIDKTFILDPADPNLSRIDLFYADQFGNVQVLKGVAGVNPARPTLDATQLEIYSVLIMPGATTPADIDVDVVYNENSEWTTSETHDTNVAIQFDSMLTPKTGSKRIKIGISIPDSVVSPPRHYIGEKYQGGVIFWLSADGKSGLIAALDDAATDVFWSRLSGFPVYSTGATGIEIGTGQANTTLMLASSAAKDSAVKYVDDFVVDGYDDWVLPSAMEASAMYLQRYEIGGFGTKTYWTSTEKEWNKASCISFSNGTLYTRDKNNNFCVRAIRAFDDLALPVGQPVQFFTPVNTKLTFVSPVTVSVKDGIFSLNMKSSIPWRYNSTLIIESFLGGVKTGMASLSPSTNMLGYNSNSDAWQLVAIPIAKFATNKETIDAFKISLVGSWPNHIDFGIDDIRFQHTDIPTAGVVVAPGTYGSTKKSAVITINAQGVVTNIIEVDTTPVDEVMIGAVNGVNRIFSTSVPYEPGTITVFINALKERGFTEISNTQIELAEAPKNTGIIDLIEATYIKKHV